MGRMNRIWYPGATYHVMCRGNRRGDIFREEEDYVTYLRIVSIAKRRYPFFLYDYCLMTNHVHLQLQTLDDEIWLSNPELITPSVRTMETVIPF